MYFSRNILQVEYIFYNSSYYSFTEISGILMHSLRITSINKTITLADKLSKIFTFFLIFYCFLQGGEEPG